MNRILFVVAHLFFKPKVLFLYFYYMYCRNCSQSELEYKLSQRLRGFLQFCMREVPFYNGKIEMDGDVFEVIDKMPIINKLDIIKNRDVIEVYDPHNNESKTVSTGGSTGEPLVYRLSNSCDQASLALLYRGWSKGGYRLGDKVAVLAGGSLVGKSSTLKSKLISYCLSMRKYSSYGMDDSILEKYAIDMVKWKPKFLRGYPSSIYELAKFVDAERDRFQINLKSIFTTAEMLSSAQRKYIENVFQCPVYDGYGLNDGGLSAFECEFHDGYHIDTERGYLEVVDEGGRRIYGRVGRIVATSFINKATPFVRYDTGDLGVVSQEKCECGSSYPLLKSLEGRVTDMIEFGGFKIGTPVLTVLMGPVLVNKYQFIQESNNCIRVVLSVSDEYEFEVSEKYIENSLRSHLGDIDVVFDYSGGFVLSKSGKHKIAVKGDCFE
ncbi:phenylacetate--CoA ligase family protein [Oceanospirillum sanctuarii]|uniref:phenylacetate--CoA ligase family protein n=1 Tax=Oceanospirillum sanctuarii TaxID=1434821 RepID=UPI000A3C7FCD|nr:phenylacetate--CoA ligase family protein [Oceanospirillum sanctuarii]